MQSIALFPTDKVWSRNETLVATGNKNYNLDNLQEFFTDIGHPEGWDIYQDTRGLTYDLTPPNVKVSLLLIPMMTVLGMGHSAQKPVLKLSFEWFGNTENLSTNLT